MESAQRLLRVELSRSGDGALAPGEYLDVTDVKADVQDVRLESLLKATRNFLHPSLMSLGINGFDDGEADAEEETDDWAKATDASTKMRVIDFIIADVGN